MYFQGLFSLLKCKRFFFFFRPVAKSFSRQDESQILPVLRHRKGLHFTQSMVGLTGHFLLNRHITTIGYIFTHTGFYFYHSQENQTAVTRIAGESGDYEFWYELTKYMCNMRLLKTKLKTNILRFPKAV